MNGLKLSKKYLSEEHPLTLKLKSKLNKINDDDEREDIKRKSMTNYLLKSPNTSEDRYKGNSFQQLNQIYNCIVFDFISLYYKI